MHIESLALEDIKSVTAEFFIGKPQGQHGERVFAWLGKMSNHQKLSRFVTNDTPVKEDLQQFPRMQAV